MLRELLLQVVKIKREMAIYLSNSSHLKKINKINFQRLYFGTEFCEIAYPNVQELKKALVFTHKNNIDFTLVLPWQTEFFRLNDYLTQLPKKTEVVINDWGQLFTTIEYGLTPILGRLLVKSKNEPRTIPENLEYIKTNSMLNHDSFKKFISMNNINRVEIDNIPLSFSPGELKSSLYFPYINISISRKCLTAFQDKNPIKNDYKCNLECKNNKGMNAKIKNYEKTIIYKGNGIFYMNKDKPQEEYLIKKNVDRFVFMPEIPY